MSRVRGKVSVHPRGFGFLDLLEPAPVTSAFIGPPLLNPYLAGDVVTAELVKSGADRYNATELALEARTKKTVFGRVVRRGPRLFLRVDRQVSNTDWPLVCELDSFEEGTALVCELKDSAMHPLQEVAEAEQGLVQLITRYDLDLKDDEAAVKEAEAVRNSPAEASGDRRDLRELLTLTIDGKSSKDLDDALSILPAAPDGAMRCFISIADVDAHVFEGSALDTAARDRSTTVYLAGAVLPMIPRALSEDALSLLPGRERNALTVELRIDGEGEVRSVDVYKSLIKSDARLDYQQVAAFLDRGAAEDIPESLHEVLRWLRTAAARLQAVRAGRGGVKILREEATIMLDEDSLEPTRIDARMTTSAHTLVERLMVAANEAVGRWLVERGLPGVFRVLEAPAADRVRKLANFARNFGFEAGFTESLTPRGLQAFENQFRGTEVEPAMSKVLTQVLGPARYTVHPGAHFGLAAPLYVHFTSPIRRYADLTVHRIVKRYLSGVRSQVAGDEKIELLCAHINLRAFRAAKAERERFRMLAARLFASEVGSTYAGNIVAIRPFGLVVQLSGAGVAGTVAADTLGGGPYRYDEQAQTLASKTHSYTIGSPIVVEVVGVSEELGRIELVENR